MESFFEDMSDQDLISFTNAYTSVFLVGDDVQNCYVSKSKVHGNGLFASRDLKKGDYITSYPPHFVVITPNPTMDIAKITDEEIPHCVVPSPFNPHLTLEYEIMKTYCYEINRYIKLCGLPDKIDNYNMLGHMPNDGVKGHSTRDNYIFQDEEIYNNVSRLKNNSEFEIHESTYVYLMATKNIRKDEEILVSYNYGYWISVNSRS